MGGTSIWHWVVVGLIVMLLFGRGKISELMGDVAKGIKSFKKGMAEEDAPAVTTTTTGTTTTEPVRTLEHQPGRHDDHLDRPAQHHHDPARQHGSQGRLISIPRQARGVQGHAMFDMSWGEVLVIGAVALIVIGPKDLPKALRTVGNMIGKIRAWRASSRASSTRRCARPSSTT
jgi:sec-independent protein translocase protein TatA